jgi:transcriptional regulator with XRE-family HTH domain
MAHGSLETEYAVPDVVSPTVRRRRLAAELRRLRERSNLTGDQVATRLKWSPSKVSRYELARSGLRPADVKRLLGVYGVSADRQEELLALARQAEEKGWWEDYSDILDDDYIAIIGLEAEAVSALSWHLDVVPGLLQTADYARQVNAKGLDLGVVPPGRIERSVKLRMARQQVLRREPPLRLSAIIDESVLLRRIAEPRVMREQLERLVEIAQLPNVTLRVLRLRQDYPIIMNSFDLLKFGDDRDTAMADVVWTESLMGAMYFDGEFYTYKYQVVHERLAASALSPEDSVVLIDQAARAWS